MFFIVEGEEGATVHLFNQLHIRYRNCPVYFCPSHKLARFAHFFNLVHESLIIIATCAHSKHRLRARLASAYFDVYAAQTAVVWIAVTQKQCIMQT